MEMEIIIHSLSLKHFFLNRRFCVYKECTNDTVLSVVGCNDRGKVAEGRISQKKNWGKTHFLWTESGTLDTLLSCGVAGYIRACMRWRLIPTRSLFENVDWIQLNGRAGTAVVTKKESDGLDGLCSAFYTKDLNVVVVKLRYHISSLIECVNYMYYSGLFCFWLHDKWFAS